MAKVIVFLDALDPRECVDWLAETMQGRVISGVPRVTPPIIGSFLTGKSPGEHGLVQPTPLYDAPMQRPDGETIIDVVAKRAKVLSYLIPFTLGVNPPNAIVCQAGMAGEANIPAAQLNFVQADGDPVHVPPEKRLGAYIDNARQIFSTMRHLIRNGTAAVYFIGFRDIDALTHWDYDGDYRQRLIEYVAIEMEDFAKMGDDVELMWFSDHGGGPKRGRLVINRWLMERGYLKITFLEKRFQQQMEMLERQGQKPHKDQVAPQSPFIQIEPGSKFISVDAFDSCIDVLEATEDEIEELRKKLEATPYFEKVYRKQELFPDCTNPKVPELIPDRKDGMLVSGNIHPRAAAPDADEVVNLRTGDHSRYGCYGGTVKLGKGDVYPTQLFHMAEELTRDASDGSTPLTATEEREVVDRLAKLGYL